MNFRDEYKTGNRKNTQRFHERLIGITYLGGVLKISVKGAACVRSRCYSLNYEPISATLLQLQQLQPCRENCLRNGAKVYNISATATSKQFNLRVDWGCLSASTLRCNISVI